MHLRYRQRTLVLERTSRCRRCDPGGPCGLGAGVHNRCHSHSIVPGGLLVTSSATRFTSRISFVMRVEILASTS